MICRTIFDHVFILHLTMSFDIHINIHTSYIRTNFPHHFFKEKPRTEYVEVVDFLTLAPDNTSVRLQKNCIFR